MLVHCSDDADVKKEITMRDATTPSGFKSIIKKMCTISRTAEGIAEIEKRTFANVMKGEQKFLRVSRKYQSRLL